MELLALLLAMFLFLRIVASIRSLVHSKMLVPIEHNKVLEGVCPPHKWRNDEVRGPDGEITHWRMICEHCGPLSQQESTNTNATK